MRLGFKKVHKDAKLPTYAHDGDAGMDVYAVDDVKLQDSRPTIVSTGLVAEIPKGYEIQVRPRSGLATKGVTVWNSPGTIDQGYTGIIGIILCYLSPNKDETTVKYFDIKKGDRIAQLVISKVTRAEIVEVDKVSETERGSGGFGSTGV